MKLLFVTIIFTVNLALPANAEQFIYLVRHAEKTLDGTHDPSLTEQGQKRAQLLARKLQNAAIKKIYSTNYKRTQQTAAPLAKLLDLQVIEYNPSKLKAFAEEIKKLKQNVLIVGHSNTTPALVKLLGGDPQGKIEESDYTRLYIVQINNNINRNEVTTYLTTLDVK